MLPCQQIMFGRAAATRVRNRTDESPGQGAFLQEKSPSSTFPAQGEAENELKKDGLNHDLNGLGSTSAWLLL
jgi:hypothetical protein